MPPAMGQPINVVEKPSSRPGIARFETNRSLTGMGHERYASVDDIVAARPVDELARRLFESGGVTEVHANGSMVTVHLADGWTGEKLLDVIRGLYIFYPPAAAADGAAADGGEPAEPAEPGVEGEASEAVAPAEPEPAAEPDAAAAPESITDPDVAVASSEAVTEPVDERVTTPDAPRSEAAPDASDA
jgi:hypothetical protein